MDGRSQERRDKREPLPPHRPSSPSQTSHLSSTQSSLSVPPVPLLIPYSISRKWEDRRRFGRRYSPEEKILRRRSPLHLKTFPVSPPKNSPSPPKQTPQKGTVDESELSEGEIVSD